MRRATWGSCVSGRCCGVRESSSQRLTPKGTAPLLHCPDPRKARAAFHGACPRPPRMAMPVARYTDVAGPDARLGDRAWPRSAGHASSPPTRLRGARERFRTDGGPTRAAGGAATVAPGPPAVTMTCRAGPPGRPPSRPPVRLPSRRPVRPRGRIGVTTPLGRAPVERLISAHATVCFQPTSGFSRFLVELADQPPCQQAGRDQAVRFHPMGTGHERQAHFPARLTSETLRDRMLPARLPCRHKAGW